MPVRGLRWVLALALLSLVAATVARAQEGCEMEASAVRFAPGEPSEAATATGRVRVRCPEKTSYRVSISRGLGGSYQLRRMRGPRGSTVEYNLFTSPAYREVWGDGSAGTAAVPGTGDQTFTIFGRLPAGQHLPAGEYEDSLVLTLSF